MSTKVSSKTEELQNKRAKYVARGIGNGNLSIADKAVNATITDIDGNEFIDFAAAIGTVNVGHNHPKVNAAVKEAVDKFLHPGFNVVMYESYIELAEKLVKISPGSHEKQAALFNTGAEAVENAVKFARRHTGRNAVVSFTRGFHGRTNLTMGMTSKVNPYKLGMGPFAPEIYQAPYPYMYQKPASMTDEEYIDYTINEFKDFFIATVAPETVAAVVMEPVQGEGGFIVPPKKFVQAVSEFCTEHGIVFVADEIQTGFGRTGTLFAIDQFDVVPDLMTMSKSIAAGLPLAAVVGRKEIMDAPNPGEVGGTYSGSPVACAAALAVIDVMEEENLPAKAEEVGQKIENKMNELAEKYEVIGETRRLGAMVAVELVADRTTKAPHPDAAGKLSAYANQNGLLLLTAGIKGNCIRFLTPLTITDEELNKGLAILEDAFASL